MNIINRCKDFNSLLSSIDLLLLNRIITLSRRLLDIDEYDNIEIETTITTVNNIKIKRTRFKKRGYVWNNTNKILQLARGECKDKQCNAVLIKSINNEITKIRVYFDVIRYGILEGSILTLSLDRIDCSNNNVLCWYSGRRYLEHVRRNSYGVNIMNINESYITEIRHDNGRHSTMTIEYIEGYWHLTEDERIISNTELNNGIRLARLLIDRLYNQ